MKRFIFSLILFIGAGTSAFAQTYEKLTELAASVIERDSLEQAEAYIMKALKADPANPHNALLFSNLGAIQRRDMRYEKALESYTYALNIAPRAVPVLLNRAALYLELGKNGLARVDYSLVLDLETDNQEALLMRAYIYMQERAYKAARSDYNRLLKLNPLSYKGRLGLATLAQKEGEFEESLTLLNKMIADKMDGDAPVTDKLYAVLYVARAGVEADMKHHDLALVDLEEGLRLNPSQLEAYLMRGQIYLSLKKKELAKSDFEQAVSLGAPQADVRELLQRCK